MPNGFDKNWIRLCFAIDGFRRTYGKWPTCVRIHPACLNNLREHVFTPDDFEKLQSKIELVADPNVGMEAEGDGDKRYDYGKDGFSERPDLTASEWLGVKPIHEDWQILDNRG